MPNLLPEGYEDEIITAEEVEDEQPIGYRNGIAFDIVTGDFVRDGKNKILDSNGVESWKSWCFNCVNTERYKNLAYGTDFGIELDPVFAAESHDEAESILVRQITEALLADPYGRTEYVEFESIEWPAPEAVEARIIVHGIQDTTIDITSYLTRGD